MKNLIDRIFIKDTTLYQIIRYGVVGVLNNSLGYLIYLVVTSLGVNPKAAITIFYPIVIAASYCSHLKYSFSYKGRRASSLFRYTLVYFIGYGVNLILLIMLADKLKFPHQIVQAIAIPVVAGILFIMLKFFVFPLAYTKDPV